MVLTAQTQKGEYQIADFFEVRKEVPFEIERIGPTRINPEATYDFKIRVKANQDFEGEVIESVPDSYQIQNTKYQILNNFEILTSNEQNEKLLVWEASWKAGEAHELTYTFDAPDNNPEFHLLGPVRLASARSGQAPLFEETRQWQIAVDGSGQYILLWDTASPDAPTDWSCISCSDGQAYYQIYPRGMPTYEATTSGSLTHTHTVSYVSGSDAASSGNIFDDFATGINVPSATHIHNSINSQNIGNGSNEPSYRTLKVIRSNSANPTTIPSGVIGMFDTTSLPTNWNSYSSQDTYFLKGDGSIGTSGSNTHTHSVEVTTGGPNATEIIRSGGSDTGESDTHTHTANDTSGDGSNQPNYIEVVFGKASQDTSVPAGLIAMFDATAPSGWTTLSNNGGDFYGKFIKGDSSTPGDTGGSAQHKHDDLTLTLPATSATTSDADTSPPQVGAAVGHTHANFVVSFDDQNHYPPYRDTIFAQKQPEISGTIYSSEGGSAYNCSTNTLTVRMKKNGAGDYTGDCTASDGSYSVGIDSIAVNDVLTVFLDGEDPVFATTVTRAGSTTGHSGIDLYQNVVIVRHEDSGPITNENLDQYDSGNDTDIKFTVTLSGTYNLEVLSGNELHIWTGDNYDPGGTVTTNTTGGVLHVDDGATVYLDTNGSNIGNNINIDSGATLNLDANTIANGNITIDGSLTKSTGSPTLTLRGTNTISGAGATKSFYIIAVGDATQTSATTISSSITVTGGALTTFGGSTIATSGTPNVNISAEAGNIGGGSGSISFYDLTIGGTQTLQSNITVSNNLSVSNSLALNDKNIGVTNGHFATTGSGQITCSGCTAGTATLSGSGNIGGGGTVTVYNLTISGSYTLQSETTANNDVSIGDGNSLVLNDQSLTVGGGDLTTTGSGTITCASCTGGTTTVNGTAATGIGGGSGGITFYNLTIGGTVPIVSASTVLNDLTANGTMSGSVEVTVNGTVAGTGTINMSGGTFDQRVAAAENFGTTSGSNSWNFSTLKFTNSSSTSRTISTQAASGGITVSTLLQIGNDGPTDAYPTVLDAGNRTWTLSGTGGTPFDIKTSTNGASTLTGSTSTFTYTGVYGGGDTNVQATTGSSYYYNLTFNGAETYAAEGAVIVNNDLTITTGTLSMGAYDLTVGTDTTTGDISVAASQSLTQSASGTATVKTFNANTAIVGGAGTLTFYHLNLSPTNAGGTIRLGSGASQTITVLGNLTVGNGIQSVTVDADTNDPTLSVTGNFSISSGGTFQAPSYTSESLTVGGTYNNSGTFTHDSGKITFNGSGTGKTLSGTMTGTSSFNYLTFNGSSGVSWTFGSNSATIANDLSIAANNSVTAPGSGQTLTITGNYSNSGTFTHNSGTVTFNAGDTGNTLSGSMTGSSSFNNLTFNNGGGSWTFGSNPATVANNFEIANANTVTAPSTTLIIGGNFTKSAGTFAHNNGTVTFNDSGKTSTLIYNADITFFGFTCTTASKELYFDNVDQTNVANTFTIDGSACGTMVKLWSDSSGNQYDLNVTAASPSIQYADIKDSNAVTGLIANNSKSSGNVSGWTINGGVCGGVAVSGNAYDGEDSTAWTECDGSTLNISLVVNGSLQQTEKCNASTGVYTFYTVDISANNPVSVFFNATDKGVAVTVAADGSSSITLNPRKNITWVKTEGAVSSISNANLDHCDSGVTNCTNVPYTVTSNNLTTESGIELHVESSKTYDPNGTVSTNATGGDLHVDDNATCYLDSATSSIGRNVLVDGGATLDIQNTTTIGGGNITTSGTSATVTYTGTPSVTISGSGNIGGGTSPSISFYDLTISGTQTITSAISAANDLTVNGTMNGSSNVTVNGAIDGTGTVNMSGGTVEQRVEADKNFGGTGGNAWTFSTLMFSNSSGASRTITTQSDSGGITASTLLQIGKAGDSNPTVLNAGNRTWTLSGTTGTPFDIIGSSSLTASTSTFSYTGNNPGGDTTVQTATYNDLSFNASETFNAEGTIIANDDLTVTNGTLAMGANDLTVGSTGATDSGDISVAGSLTQSSSGTTTVKSSASGSATVGGAGTLTFYNLTLAPDANGATIYLGSAGGQTITVSNDLTIGNGANTVTVNADNNDPTLDVNGGFSTAVSGTFQASNTGTFQVAKNFTDNGTFTHNSGTVIFDTTNTATFNGSGTPAITFNNFTSATAGKTLQFTESKTFRIEGLFTITGQSGSKIEINSTSGTQWLVDHQGTENVTYVNVQNSGCAGGTTDVTLSPTSSDQGNNGTCWVFQAGKRVKSGVRIRGGVRIK